MCARVGTASCPMCHRTIRVSVGFLTGEVPRISFTSVGRYAWVFNGAQPLNGLLHRTDMRRHMPGSPAMAAAPFAGDGCCLDRNLAAGIGSQRRVGSRDAPAGPPRLRGGVCRWAAPPLARAAAGIFRHSDRAVARPFAPFALDRFAAGRPPTCRRIPPPARRIRTRAAPRGCACGCVCQGDIHKPRISRVRFHKSTSGHK